MSTAPRAGIATVDVANSDVVAGELCWMGVGVEVVGEPYPGEDDASDAAPNQDPLATKPPANLKNEYHG